MAYKNDQDRIEKTHNAPRFFVEHPQVSWVLLIGVLVWGWFGYHSMPQRKDPDIPVRVAVAFCAWPGATAQQVEQFLTRPIEDAVAENKTIHPYSFRLWNSFGLAPRRGLRLCPARRKYLGRQEAIQRHQS